MIDQHGCQKQLNPYPDRTQTQGSHQGHRKCPQTESESRRRGCHQGACARENRPFGRLNLPISGHGQNQQR